MSQAEWVRLSLHIAAMLIAALGLGQLFRRFGLPAVAGEISAGILLGPTLLGRVSPEVFQYLFPVKGPVFEARTAMMRTGMLTFIVTIGLGISLAEFRRVGKKALGVGTVGTFVPLGIGIAVAYAFPGILGLTPKDQFGLALFLGAILSLSANPIIARILIDLGLFHKEIGRIIMSATLVDDIVGWGLFAVVLAAFGPNAKGDAAALLVVPMLAGYFVVVITFGRYVMPTILRLVRRTFPQPMGLIGVVIAFVLVCAAGSEAIGLHSFLGAFLAGISIAEVYDEFQEALDIIANFSIAVFTPVFFVSMGITADFYEGFNLLMILLVTVGAFFGKILGVYLGGKMVGMTSREALAVGCGLNARGILGIVMASVAYEQKLIGLEMFVACVLMCLITTIFAGPALKVFHREPTTSSPAATV